MVGIAIQCRLGNQLFQYAFIKALSQRLNVQFVIVENSEQFTAQKYFNFKGYNKHLNIIKWIIFKIFTKNIFTSLTPSKYSSDSSSDWKVFNDYFQSEKYFKELNPIYTYISIKNKYIQQFQEKYKDVFTHSKVIAVHLRRGDYLNLNDWWKENLGSHDLTLPDSYYTFCLSQIQDIDKYKIIFLSDDISYAKEKFSYLPNAFSLIIHQSLIFKL